MSYNFWQRVHRYVLRRLRDSYPGGCAVLCPCCLRWSWETDGVQAWSVEGEFARMVCRGCGRSSVWALDRGPLPVHVPKEEQSMLKCAACGKELQLGAQVLGHYVYNGSAFCTACWEQWHLELRQAPAQQAPAEGEQHGQEV